METIASADPPSGAFPGADEMAAAFVAATAPRWEGQTVPAPRATARPSSSRALSSMSFPLTVHASSLEAERVLPEALASLEDAFLWSRRDGWGRPSPDGGLGGSSNFDLYLVDRASEGLADGAIDMSFTDRESTYAIVDWRSDQLGATVLFAYSEALLLSRDPAESLSWRRSTARMRVGRLLGVWDVEGGTPDHWQAEATTAVLQSREGGLWLSAAEDLYPGIIRDAWAIAEQRSFQRARLRGSPDLWESLALASEIRGTDLRALAEGVAAERWLGSRGARPTERRAFTTRLSNLSPYGPTRMLEAFASQYAIVELDDFRERERLRVWVRGEFGVAWSLVAVVLGSDGEELTRINSVIRVNDDGNYLPVELTTEMKRVIVIATNLSHRLPDEDVGDENARSCRFAFERVVDEGE